MSKENMLDRFVESLNDTTKQLRLMKTRTELERSVYSSVSKFVKANMTHRQIHKAWEEAHLGRSVEPQTIER